MDYEKIKEAVDCFNKGVLLDGYQTARLVDVAKQVLAVKDSLPERLHSVSCGLYTGLVYCDCGAREVNEAIDEMAVILATRGPVVDKDHLYGVIEAVLNNYRLNYQFADDECQDNLSLVDVLTPDNEPDILKGQTEIGYITDDLAQAVLTLSNHKIGGSDDK